MTDTTLDLDDLLAKCEAATPGPWKTTLTDDTTVVDVHDNGQVAWCCAGTEDYEDNYAVIEANTAFIAAANPQTVRALIDAAKERDTLKTALHKFDPDDEFDRQGENPWDYEPHFTEAMGQLTKRRAYSKSACAMLIAEKAKEAADVTAERDRLREVLTKTQATLNIIANKAHEVGLEGTSDWDKIAGNADLYGCVDMVRAALDADNG